MRKAGALLSGVVLTLAFLAQIVLAIFLFDENGSDVVGNIGWAIVFLSAIFGWLPIFTLRRWGGVPKRKSYVHTTTIVDRGIYSIVRHPQYTAGILLGVGVSLIAQHWLVGLLGAIVVLASYFGTFAEDQACREKFGEAYDEYAKRVPRANFVLGLARLVWRKTAPRR